jgi:hypothetical protein
MAALSRIAVDDHRHVSVGPGDCVVFSARVIPGHERAVDRVINHLARRGVDIIDLGTKLVHVSGHGSEEELKLMLSLVRPRYFVPIHGEFRQRSRYARLAGRVAAAAPSSVGVILAENGDILRFDETRARSSARAGRPRAHRRPGPAMADESSAISAIRGGRPPDPVLAINRPRPEGARHDHAVSSRARSRALLAAADHRDVIEHERRGAHGRGHQGKIRRAAAVRRKRRRRPLVLPSS